MDFLKETDLSELVSLCSFTHFPLSLCGTCPGSAFSASIYAWVHFLKTYLKTSFHSSRWFLGFQYLNSSLWPSVKKFAAQPPFSIFQNAYLVLHSSLWTPHKTLLISWCDYQLHFAVPVLLVSAFQFPQLPHPHKVIKKLSRKIFIEDNTLSHSLGSRVWFQDVSVQPYHRNFLAWLWDSPQEEECLLAYESSTKFKFPTFFLSWIICFMKITEQCSSLGM